MEEKQEIITMAEIINKLIDTNINYYISIKKEFDYNTNINNYYISVWDLTNDTYNNYLYFNQFNESIDKTLFGAILDFVPQSVFKRHESDNIKGTICSIGQNAILIPDDAKTRTRKINI